MNRKIVLGSLVAVFLGAAFYFYGGSRVPAGQPQLQNLTGENAAGFESEFNASKGEVRVLLLLSPT